MSKELFAMIKPLKKVVNYDIYVLTNDERLTEPRTYCNYYHKFMTTLGIPKLKYHGLCHSFATRCIEVGCDYKIVSVLLGIPISQPRSTSTFIPIWSKRNDASVKCSNH